MSRARARAGLRPASATLPTVALGGGAGPRRKASGQSVRASHAVSGSHSAHRHRRCGGEPRGRARIEPRPVERQLRDERHRVVPAGVVIDAASARDARSADHVRRRDPDERRHARAARVPDATRQGAARRRTAGRWGVKPLTRTPGRGTATVSSAKVPGRVSVPAARLAHRGRGRSKNLRRDEGRARRPSRPCSMTPLTRDFARRDLVLERVRIEAVDALAARLGLRVHEEAELRAASSRAARRRARRCSAIQLPSQPPNSALYTGATTGCCGSLIQSGGFQPHHLADVGRIHRDPAVAGEPHFRAAVLRARDVGRCPRRAPCSRTPTSRRGCRRCRAPACRPRAHRPTNSALMSPHLPPMFAGLEHRLDVADAAAAHLRLAIGVGDDPVVQRAHLLDVGRRLPATCCAVVAHDAVGRHQLGRLEVRRAGSRGRAPARSALDQS